jgi:diaminopimelate decarboxylase
MTDLLWCIDDARLEGLAAKYGTPLFVYDWKSVLQCREQLDMIMKGVCHRCWLSMKTAPVKPLIQSWRELGERIEVVSPYELNAALSVGFSPADVLVNGPGKAGWLGSVEVSGLNVVFDSALECRQLARQAAKHDWLVGLRIAPRNQRDPDAPNFPDQFGLDGDAISTALASLSVEGIAPEIFQFHLRSNVRSVSDFRDALDEVLRISEQLEINPRIIDCGGGLPVEGETLRETGAPSWSSEFDQLGRVLSERLALANQVEEVWLEVGRFLTARSALLIARVLDVKERGGCRFVVCDGGRVNNAFPSDWELHEYRFIPERRSPSQTTTCICGPTCMAYDWLDRSVSNIEISPGDLLVWGNAGAYHLPFETSFSFGRAAVVWLDEFGSRLARPRESFERWWGAWN